jgi:glyoxylase-like metal-dependent hydrolase (beta-lactamase superfamily II)
MSWTRIAEGLYRWTDTCNVYALVHEGRALLIDCGAGDAVDHLDEIGAERVDWVLYTHHHREQCQGHARLTASGAKTAAPVGEANLMRDPASLWDDLNANTVYGAVHSRPPREPVSIDRTLAPLDTFEWGPFAIQVYATPGNTQGSVTYRAQIAGEWFLFSGDLILAGGTMHTFYDNEWDYGHSVGPKTMCQSLTYLRALLPATVCPSHGPVMADPEPDIRRLHATLDRFEKDWYTRAWDWNDGIGGAMDWFSRPTDITGVRKFTDNLYKLGRIGSNCYLLIGETGRGMFVDCGGQMPTHLDYALDRLRDEAGLRTIEVLIPTHVHGDHYNTLGYLRERWGAEVWCLDTMAEAMEQPYRFNSSALVPYYRLPFDTIPIARKLADRERFEWDGLELVAHDLPGQTCYTTGVELRVADKRVMFTGDNIFYTPREGQSGHEAILARNGSQIDLQYLAGAERLAEVNPDWILAGHSSEIEDARRQIPLFLEWARAMPGKFAELSSRDPYELFLDPYWMRFDPWMQRLAPGDEARVQVIVRSHHADGTRFVIAPRLPEGWGPEPAEWEGTLTRGEEARFEVRFRVPDDAPSRTHIISADLTAGDERWGEFFDGRVDVIGGDVTPPKWYDRVKG